MRETANESGWLRWAVPAGLLFVGVVLAGDSELGLIPAASVTVAGTLLGAILRESRRPALFTYAPVPVLVGLGILTVTAAPAPTAYGLAGLSGLLFLLWLGSSRAQTTLSKVTRATAIPALAFAVAFGASQLLPGAGGAFGAAVALLVGVVLYAAWFFGHPEIPPSAESPA